MKKSFILVLLLALSSNIYSQEFDISGFREGMNNMENLARKTVRYITKKRERENFHFLIVPYIYPANQYLDNIIAYTDSLLESGGILTGYFPRKEFVDFYLYNDKKEFVCSGYPGSRGTNYRCNNLGYREDEFMFNAIIALNPEFTFKPDPIAGCYYVFTKDKIYKLEKQFDKPPIVTLLYTSPK